MGDYDEETAFLGNWGKFQQKVFFLICLASVPYGLSIVSIVFLGDSPPHHCLIPEEVNLTEEWRQASIPTQEVNGETEYSRCRRYRLDLISNYSALGLSPNKDVNLSQVPLEGCSDGWFYSKEIYQSTIVTEFDLVCDNEWKQPFTTSVFFCGMICGALLCGQLSDRFGRKPVLFLTMAFQTVSFIQAFSPSWEVFLVLFFIVGMGQISSHTAAFALGIEILTGRARMIFASLGINGFYAIGYMILPLIAFLCRDWRMLQMALSVPSIVYMTLWWWIPESPRWLVSQGRVEEAEAILRAAAKMNRVKAPEIIFTRTEAEQRKSKSQRFHGCVELLKTSDIRHTTLIFCLVWFSHVIGYYGLSLNTSNLHGNPYLNCFTSAIAEVPGYIAGWVTLQYLSRRLSLSVSLFLGGGLLFIILLVPPDLPSLTICLVMIGKLFITNVFGSILAFAGEVYPTGLRNTASGTFTTVARVGCCLTPFFVQLGTYYKNLLYILLGSLIITAAIATLFLPETFGLPLPDTIEQMPKRKRIKWPCLSRERENQQRKQDPSRENPGRETGPKGDQIFFIIAPSLWNSSQKYEEF